MAPGSLRRGPVEFSKNKDTIYFSVLYTEYYAANLTPIRSGFSRFSIGVGREQVQRSSGIDVRGLRPVPASSLPSGVRTHRTDRKTDDKKMKYKTKVLSSIFLSYIFLPSNWNTSRMKCPIEDIHAPGVFRLQLPPFEFRHTDFRFFSRAYPY